jgi:hypothetical protein
VCSMQAENIGMVFWRFLPFLLAHWNPVCPQINSKMIVIDLFYPLPKAQAVSRRLPTVAARVRSQVKSCGICGGQVALGQYFGFPCQFSFHQVLHNLLSSWAGTIGQLVADVPSGLSLTPPHETKKKKTFFVGAWFWIRNFMQCILDPFIYVSSISSRTVPNQMYNATV